jgi:hypothetical protein
MSLFFSTLADFFSRAVSGRHIPLFGTLLRVFYALQENAMQVNEVHHVHMLSHVNIAHSMHPSEAVLSAGNNNLVVGCTCAALFAQKS